MGVLRYARRYVEKFIALILAVVIVVLLGAGLWYVLVEVA